MKDYALFVFDLDGVLYRGDETIPGATNLLKSLRHRGKKIRFFTNNSSKTRETRAEMLCRMGFEALPSEIYTSAYGAAEFVRDSSVFVVGESGLKEELKGKGARIVGRGEHCDWVVVGICWTFSYEMLDEAQQRIRSGAKFLATNLDRTFPDAGGRIKPGAGAIVAAISAACGKAPDLVVGKPNTGMLQSILRDAGCSARDCLVVGDRIDTDIMCADRAGCDSAIVLTGVTTLEEAQTSELRPTYVLDSVADWLAGQP